MPGEFFKFSPSFSARERDTAFDVMKSARADNIPFRDVLTSLKEQGLTYSRGAMQEDYRRMGSIAQIPDWNIGSTEKAMSFFDVVVEPFRIAKDITTNEAYRQVNDILRREEGNIGDIEAVNDLYDEFRATGFGTP